MIIGVGTDIIEIDRIEKAIKNEKFLQKYFTENEVEYFKSRNLRAQTIAGNFAGKEAISKALGTGLRGFSLKEIEILRDELGKPIVFLYGGAKQIFDGNSSINIQVSIAHNNTVATAYCIIEC
ncbi:holo-[acyl-carrier-protein] synthase [Clostridium cavendishii DSM 21758]|uniref:Holo-[acyl-carrier-protein] synthase n=1 Tax=Clostridium cavendishii DSM 21758 TaxID=1121302 RepID=A0A1M6TTQ5_9CLOT|nr:holo-ACP synthase [Clostridium cavendishii]SHK60304.1 holo-[acyl-carrier-protein] synthase [Clostridium cavendishii DSM 21758]